MNEGFISNIKFFLSLTLLYNVKFSQILIQILMKKPSRPSSSLAVEKSIKPFHRIYVIITIIIIIIIIIINLSLALGRLKFFSVIYGPFRSRGWSVEQLSLLLRVSYMVVLSGDWTTGSSFVEFKSPNENFASLQKDCPWLSCCVQDSSLWISGNLRGQLYLRIAIAQGGCSRAFFLCAKDHATI